MKIFGMLLIMASALGLCLEERKKCERRLLLFEELLRFIEKMRVDISCYLKPISEIPLDFSSELLSELGFLSDFERLGAEKAFSRISPVLSPEASGLLGRFFSVLGKGYAEEQLRLIDETLREYTRLVSLERERAPKVKKLSLSLSCAGALALIILLV